MAHPNTYIGGVLHPLKIDQDGVIQTNKNLLFPNDVQFNGQINIGHLPIITSNASNEFYAQKNSSSISSSTLTKMINYSTNPINTQSFGTWNSTTGIFTFSSDGIYIVEISGTFSNAVESGKFNYQIQGTGKSLYGYTHIIDLNGHYWTLTGTFRFVNTNTLEIDLASIGSAGAIGSGTSDLNLYIFRVV